MRVVWQCESDAYCRAVLARHWPGVPCHPDVRALVADPECGRRNGLHERVQARHLAPDAQFGGEDGAGGITAPDPGREREAGPLPVPVPRVDVLCGGFPCQDISLAGRGAGIDGERSGLWSQFARLIRELRPRYVLVENVPALLARGMGRVLADLAACGYDSEWDCLPASSFGAPHQRDRVWVVAYPGGDGVRDQSGRRDGQDGAGAPELGDDGAQWAVADADDAGRAQRRWAKPGGAQLAAAQRGGQGMADAARIGGGACGALSYPEAGANAWLSGAGRQWEFEPDVGRVASRVPARVDRLRALGNSLVPQIAQWIGRRVIDAETAR
jgi:DNA (cytosine-5)-methyltransferase 1